MGRSSRRPEDPPFTASDFLAMVTTKMKNLRASTADSPPPFFGSTDSIFDGFRPILETDLLVFCNLKSCEVDPLPPFIIADVVDDIAPFLLYLLDGSISDDYLPDSQNTSPRSRPLQELPRHFQPFLPFQDT